MYVHVDCVYFLRLPYIFNIYLIFNHFGLHYAQSTDLADMHLKKYIIIELEYLGP